jgi:hypothetical protein
MKTSEQKDVQSEPLASRRAVENALLIGASPWLLLGGCCIVPLGLSLFAGMAIVFSSVAMAGVSVFAHYSRESGIGLLFVLVLSGGAYLFIRAGKQS